MESNVPQSATQVGELSSAQSCDLARAVDRFLEHCRIGRSLSGHTLRAYRGDLSDFSRAAGVDVEPATIAKESVREYVRVLKDIRRLHASSVRRKVATLKVF